MARERRMAQVRETQVSIRRGRRAGVALLVAIVTTFTAVCSFQIIQQAWSPPGRTGNVECREGVSGLIRAVHRAREAAARSSGGERSALEMFRRTLEPEWSLRADLSGKCAQDAAMARALPKIDRLRFAEEHALRYEALDVASRRREVDAIEQQLRETP